MKIGITPHTIELMERFLSHWELVAADATTVQRHRAAFALDEAAGRRRMVVRIREQESR